MNKDVVDANKQPALSTPWRTIRVFISSTFRDMHAERDFLARTVFPELKEMCRKLRVHLIDVDLRWGVSEADAEGGKAIDICLDEIDSCRPYFLGLIGHRYGYIPPGQHHSITAEEIYHGVLYTDIPKQILDLNKIITGKLEDKILSRQESDCLSQNYLWDAERRKFLLRDDLHPKDGAILRSIFKRYSIYQKDRSYFFFRSESFSRLLAGDHPDDFFEADALAKLHELKAEIKDGNLPVFEYDNLESFGQLVRDVLWAKIEAEVKEAVVEKEWLEQETEFHELFMADRTRRFVGRRELLERMHTFSEMGDAPPLLIIRGESGSGKSALMSRFAEETMQRHPDWLVIPHFVGASPNSTNLRQTLIKFCSHIYKSCEFEKSKLLKTTIVLEEYNRENKHEANTNKLNDGSDDEKAKIRTFAKEKWFKDEIFAIEKEFNVPNEIDELAAIFPKFLDKTSPEKKLLFIIDAVNQLDKIDNAHSMSWLPQILPNHVRFIISSLAGEAHDALLARSTVPQVEHLPGLSSSEIQELVKRYLSEIRHAFPNLQVETEFFAKIEKGNPLYILVALEELRVFGKFEELENRIRKLPNSVPDLFAQVLERIEGDFSPTLVRECLAFMACGRQGMTAEELQTLLRKHVPWLDQDVEPVKLPDLVWRRLYRSMSAYLFEHSGVIDFFHGQFKAAVEKRYFTQEADRVIVHRHIADYFENRWQSSYVRAIDELPHHRIKALDWTGLERVLCDLKFIEAKASIQMTHGLLADYDTAISTQGFPSQTPIHDFARFITAQSHVIAANPNLTFQQAINEPDTTIPAIAANKILNAGQETRPFFLWINKPQAASTCLKTITGHNDKVLACSFSPDGSRIVSASKDKTIRFWDTATGKELAVLIGHNESIEACLFSPDGLRIISSSYKNPHKSWVHGELDARDKTLKLWDVTTIKELASLTAHDYKLSASTFSPNGSRFITPSDSKTLKLWDAVTGKELASLIGHNSTKSACSFSPDGSRFVAASDGMTLKLWDATTGTDLATLIGHTSYVEDYAFSPDGSLIISASNDKTLKLWDAITGKELATLAGHDDKVNACTFSPDGSRIISASDDRTLKLWDSVTGRELATLTGHNDKVITCTFSPDGTRIVSRSYHALKLWDSASGRELSTLIGYAVFIRGCAFSPNSMRIVASSNENTYLWDAITGEEVASLIGPIAADGKQCPTFSPDGSRIAARFDLIIKIWDALNGKELATLTGHSESVNSFSFSPDGSRILSASDDKTLKLWDVEIMNESPARTNYIEGVIACAFSPNASHIVTVSKGDENLFSGRGEAHLKLWDTTTGRELATLSGHSKSVTACAFSPNGSRIVSASRDETLKLWNASTGKILTSLIKRGCKGVNNFEDEEIYSCAYSPDGSQIVSASVFFQRGTLFFWDEATGRRVAGISYGDWIKGIVCAFSPDGLRIVSSSGDMLRLWDRTTRKELAMLIGHDSEVTACAFSPDGTRIVSASKDKSLKLWDASNGRELATLIGHNDEVSACAFSPDGSSIVSASRDRKIKLWDVIMGKEIGGFYLIGEGNCLCWSNDGLMLAVGDNSGPIVLLQPSNLIGPPIITAWLNPNHKSIFHWKQKNALRFGCSFCQKWSVSNESDLGKTISCPKCGKSLQLNLFTINADWHPIARAWKRQ